MQPVLTPEGSAGHPPSLGTEEIIEVNISLGRIGISNISTELKEV